MDTMKGLWGCNLYETARDLFGGRVCGSRLALSLNAQGAMPRLLAEARSDQHCKSLLPGSPKVCKIMAFMAVVMGLRLSLFTSFWGLGNNQKRLQENLCLKYDLTELLSMAPMDFQAEPPTTSVIIPTFPKGPSKRQRLLFGPSPNPKP